MIPSVEFESAVKALKGKSILTADDLAAEVARRRVESGRDAIAPASLRHACARWLHRNFGRPTDAEVEADIAERLAEAEKIGAHAVRALVNELRIEAARALARADALRADFDRRARGE